MFVNDKEKYQTVDETRGAVLEYAGIGREETGYYFVLTWLDKPYPFMADVDQHELGPDGPWELVWTILNTGHGKWPQRSGQTSPPAGGWMFIQKFDSAEEERDVIGLIQEALTVYRVFFGRGKGDVREVAVAKDVWHFEENKSL